MNNRKSRRVIHSRKNKLLRKINTKNLLLAGSLLSLGALTTHQLDAIYAEASSEIISYLQSENASSFEGKEDLLNELMLEEIKKAQESQSEEWKENTAEDIKAEIERQKELGLEAYVVQWGDTLEMLAEATEQTVDYLVEINQLDEDQDLLVGDLLTGILETVEDEGQRITELPGLVQTGNNTITQPVQPAKPVVITEVKEITVTEGIDFEEIKRDNLDLFVGESKLIQKGQLGEKALLYKVTYHNGKEVNRELLSQEIVKEAIAEIVEIGTKDKIESFQEVETTEILFKTVKEESDELLKGETRVAQEGINGKAQLVYKVTVTNGKETARELIRQETSQEAIDKIIKIGTKVEVTYKNETINESIPFETIERDNGELEIGESKVLQEGKEGIKSKVYKVTYHNGKEVSRELVEEEVSVAPVNKIIEKGTKEPVVEYVTVEFRDNHGILGGQLKSIKVKKEIH
ncbi:G5 domain-containing protein [Ruoffia tabacinasalis]|uniref:G5 domain-containing protein n=1 Tax=Ruoffia tabacinasalis TaxID=87458 RepID=UPI0030CF15D6